jgi:hypothetical protein
LVKTFNRKTISWLFVVDEIGLFCRLIDEIGSEFVRSIEMEVSSSFELKSIRNFSYVKTRDGHAGGQRIAKVQTETSEPLKHLHKPRNAPLILISIDFSRLHLSLT